MVNAGCWALQLLELGIIIKERYPFVGLTETESDRYVHLKVPLCD